MVIIVRQPATAEQLAQMSDAFGETLIKLAVDIERGILAGGGELHADCEAHYWRTAVNSRTYGERIGIPLTGKWGLKH